MARVRIEIAGDRHLETLGNCGGYYACPVSEGTRERMGPLVGYAGKYTAGDGSQKQWVGEIYANFAMAEVRTNVLKFFAGCLACRIDGRIGLGNVDYFCGAPIGGYSLADALGFAHDIDVIKAEKKVTALATATEREKSKLFFGRHSIESGARYVIVEDVCNNFSTTAELVELIIAGGGEVAAIVCFLNRSTIVSNTYFLEMGRGEPLQLPVISLVRMPIDEWKQDDPAVAEDIARGNVAWKPKDEWDRLMQAMKGAS